MSQWYEVIVSAGSHLNIRSGAGMTYTDLGDLFRGDKVEVVERSGDWGRFVKLVRVNGTVETPTVPSWCNCNPAYCVATIPPVVVVKVPFTLTVEGYKPYSGELEKA